MMNFKGFYTTIESTIKPMLDEVIRGLYRENREEFRKEDNHEEIEWLFLDASEVTNDIINIVLPAIALYDYNAGKLKHFAKISGCPTLNAIIDENQRFDANGNNDKYLQSGIEQYITNKLIERYNKRTSLITMQSRSF